MSVAGDQARALRAALAWLGQSAPEILSQRPTWVQGIKRLSEVALLARYILDGELGRSEPELAAQARGWLEVGWRILRRGDFLVDCIAQDPVWVGLASSYLPFHRQGLRSPRFEELLRQRVDRVELGWFVRLSVACALAQLGIPSKLAVDALAANAWAFRVPGPLQPDPARAYETTHVVMWLGEVGRIPAAQADRLRAWAPAWIDHYRRARNVDVVAELVLMLHILDRCAAEATWDWLLEQQDPDGSFPEMDIPSRVRGRFHVTVATSFALATCLGRPACRAAALTPPTG